jgi:predicted 3-demethylubiquinone-9 3-methyltransferase (glyoxalase superfamily)
MDDGAAVGGRITPFLWFDGRAEEAANFYVSVFEKSATASVSYTPSTVLCVSKNTDPCRSRAEGNAR